MGSALHRAVPSVRRALDSLPIEASSGLTEAMFAGRDELLFPPVDSPFPSLFFEVTVALSLSVARALRLEGVRPDCAAGRSVGEFAAFAFSGAVPAGFCFSAIQEFSRLGQRNCISRPSLLLTVYGADRRCLEGACRRLSVKGRVCELVNFYSRLNAGVLVVFSIVTLDKLKIDDPVGAISVHGVVGLLGLMLVPVTNDGTSFVGQLVGALTIFVWVFAASMVVWLALKATIGIRVSEEEEYEGVDIGECGLEAYPEFTQAR